MCEEFESVDNKAVFEAVDEYLFDLKMESIIKKRLEDGQKPIPVNLEDLLRD